MGGTQDNFALVGFAGSGSSSSIHSHCLAVVHWMIRKTFAEVVVRVVTSKVVGCWFQSQSRSCCSAAGMPCVLVGKCRQDKVYPSSRVQDSEDVQSRKSIVFAVARGTGVVNYLNYSSIRDLAEVDHIRQLHHQQIQNQQHMGLVAAHRNRGLVLEILGFGECHNLCQAHLSLGHPVLEQASRILLSHYHYMLLGSAHMDQQEGRLHHSLYHLVRMDPQRRDLHHMLYHSHQTPLGSGRGVLQVDQSMHRRWLDLERHMDCVQGPDLEACLFQLVLHRS